VRREEGVSKVRGGGVVETIILETTPREFGTGKEAGWDWVKGTLMQRVDWR